MTRPFLIGVTGNIACGKSTVMRELAELGATVIDGDLVYRDLTGPGSPLVCRLVDAFGDRVANPDGSLNRPELGKIVFSDPAALHQLDQLTHPDIVAEVERRIHAATTPIVATDGIKLIESGLGDRCDEIWVVKCGRARQRQRLIKKRGLSAEAAERRISAQPPAAEKIARADVVIRNDGTLADLRLQVQSAWIGAAAKASDRGYYRDGYET